jgi:hypothetical protein
MVSSQNLTRNTPFLVERRRELRVSQPGSVNITLRQSNTAITFPAAVVDTSEGGMCIRHWRKELVIGDEVKVSLSGSDGEAELFSATVAWNWTVGPVVMSGLEKADREKQVNSKQAGTSGDRKTKLSSVIWASLTVLAFALGWLFTKIW